MCVCAWGGRGGGYLVSNDVYFQSAPMTFGPNQTLPVLLLLQQRLIPAAAVPAQMSSSVSAVTMNHEAEIYLVLFSLHL